MEGENSQLQCSWPPSTPFKGIIEETREKQVDWFLPGFGLGREGQVSRDRDLSSYDFAAKGKEKVVNVSDDTTINGIGTNSELLGVMGSLCLSDGIGGQSRVSIPDCSTNELLATHQDHLNFVPDTSHPMPKTPVKAGRAENTQVPERRELLVSENEERIDPTSQPVTDSAGNKKIDLNKTPQKKPIRRRKHRPKIVTEGKKKPKHNFKPVTVKRKYVQRKGVNKSTSITPSAEIVNGDLAGNSCRRALDYTLEDNNMLKSKTQSGAISLNDSNRGASAAATEARARGSKRKHSPVMEQASSANRTEVDQGSGHWVDFPNTFKRKRSRNRPKLVASSHLDEMKSDAMQPRKSGRQGLVGNQRTKLYLMPSTRPERLIKRASLNKSAVCEVQDIFPGKEGLLKHIVSTMGPVVPKKRRVFHARVVNAGAIAVDVHDVNVGVDAVVVDADVIAVDVPAIVMDTGVDAVVVDAIVMDVPAVVVDAGADATVVAADADATIVDAGADATVVDANVVDAPAIVVDAGADAIHEDVPAIVVDAYADAAVVDVDVIVLDAADDAIVVDGTVDAAIVDATADAIDLNVAAADIDADATGVHVTAGAIDLNVAAADIDADATGVHVTADATIVDATAVDVPVLHTDADAAAKKSRWRGFIKEIIAQLKQLDINRESDSAMHQERNALVLYRNDGTIVPYNPIKTKPPRARVDIDEETNNMFLLLLKNINHEGVDGSDEEKQRWWEEERRVFCGRADSFVARMHLIQGDRRFSQWKGSVVDSVVGVFLTQNVSDHLSSSAYLSLAARFPLKSNSDQKPVHEEEAIEVCNLELDSEQATELRNMPYQHVSGQSSMTFQDNDHNADKVVPEGNSSPGIKTADVSLSEIINCCSLNFPETYVQTYNIAPDGMISSQESVTSYQKICECPFVENDERLGSHSQINSEAEKLVNRSQPNGLNDPTSLMDILTMAGSTMLCQDSSRKCENSKDARISGDQSKLTEISTSQCVVQENNQSINHQGEENNKVQQTMNLPNLSVEMGIAESTISEEQKNDEEKAAKDRALKEKNSMKQKSKRVGREISDDFNWDTLRREAEANGKKERQMNTMDSLDWEAVRRADVDEIAETIKDRGMHNQLAARIKAFLNRVVDDHGSIDLEWVREIEPDKAKEYLLSVNGLGLKSVECIRLLALQHLAFPVDTNVGRIAVRLGWVPLQPLPESLQLHLLELYPVMDSIQKYLWPRLCKLPQKDLYELHYQMITFGKVFCTKRKPNCNACPMRGECRHFASAFASARLALPAPEEKGIVCAHAPERIADPVAAVHINALLLPPPQAIQQSEGNLQEEAGLRMAPKHRVDPCEPIIELPEEPASPEPESTQYQENDIEDYQYTDDPDDIPEIKLNVEEFTRNLQCYMENNMELQEGEMSKALVALTPGEASIPMPKLKNVSRLRTEHQV